jgi:hypothetical protein
MNTISDKDKAEGRSRRQKQKAEAGRHGARSTEHGGDIGQEGTRRR